MQKSKTSRRPIDRMRDGGGHAAITPEFGKIVAIMTADHRIYLIAERGVSSGVMADQIDPDRQNASIPQIVQRQELTYGAEAPFIQNTLCVAVALLNPTHLPENFPKESGMLLALSVAQEIAAVTDIIAELHQHAVRISAEMARGEVKREHLPRTPNLRSRVEQAIGHLRKVQLEIQRLSRLFYPHATPNVPWIEPVLAALADDDPFRGHLDLAVKTLDEIANCRHAMTHSDAFKRLNIFDYDLNAAGSFIAPTIEVVHPKTPLSRRNVVQYLDTMSGELVRIFAGFLATFCDRNVRSFAPMFETRVVQIPDAELRAGSPFVWETRTKEGFNPSSVQPQKP